MQLFTDLKNMLGSHANADSMKKLLTPAALGGIAGALLTTSTGRKLAGGAALGGGVAALAAVLFDKYKDALPQFGTAEPAAQPQATLDRRITRLITAMVFAAKSDGHIDPKEQEAIQARIDALNVDASTDAILHQAMELPLDPSTIAHDVSSPEEAMEVFIASCTVISIDHFMENTYLDELARQLHIPADVAQSIKKDVSAAL
jgi:uncharacterized membrane protein YebE (DUF533 family)